jgi:hypothetical protein
MSQLWFGKTCIRENGIVGLVLDSETESDLDGFLENL